MGITGHNFKKFDDEDEDIELEEFDEVTVSIVDIQRQIIPFSMPVNTFDSESDEPLVSESDSDDDYEPETEDDCDDDGNINDNAGEIHENGISEEQENEDDDAVGNGGDDDNDDDDIDDDFNDDDDDDEEEEDEDDDIDDDDDEFDSDSSSVKSLRAGREQVKEDDLIKKIKEAKKIKKQQPPKITHEDMISSISFSPTNDIIAIGDAQGDIFMYSYDLEKTEVIMKYAAHNGSCRKVEYDDDGELLYSISDDRAVIVSDPNNGKFKNSFDNAHDIPIYSLHIINKNLFCTGDDDGIVKLWDRRKRSEVFTMKISDDYISSLRGVDESSMLACTSGDGTITGLNMNTRKIMTKSEPYGADLTCSGLFCSNTKLAVGTSIGSLLMYSWSQFFTWNDEFPAVDKAKRSINCMIPITENIVITGLDNGKIRATHLFPMRHIGIVGQHDGTIEGIDINRDGTLIATHSDENTVCFWNVEYFEEISLTDKMKTNNEKAKEHNLPSSSGINSSDFFAGLA